MGWLIIILVLLALVFGPGLWVKRVMQRYSKPADRYQGTGGQLARYLLDQLDLKQVKVEVAADGAGDHYDPDARIVRLASDKYDSCSLTAITVAAHEVGHAIQHRDGYPPLIWRTRLVKWVEPAQKLAAGAMIISPFIGMFTRMPVAGLMTFFIGFIFLGLMPLIHLITLPVEFDASFGRAMPILTDGGFLIKGDEPHARRLLTAAACTYVAVSLMSLLNVARWLVLVRR